MAAAADDDDRLTGVAWLTGGVASVHVAVWCPSPSAPPWGESAASLAAALMGRGSAGLLPSLPGTATY